MVLLVALALMLCPFRTGDALARQPVVDVVVAGLFNPRSLAFGPDGSLYVAEAGRGGDLAVRAGFYRIPCQIGRTARVTRVMPSGARQVVLDELPSIRTPDDIFGATAVTFVDDTLFVLTAAGGRDVGDTSFDNAILRVSPGGGVDRLVDITALNYASPPLARLRDLRADVEGGVPFGLTALGGRLYATDSNLETVTEIALDGSHRGLVELPASNRVLVGLAPAPDGSLWIAEYGPQPHLPGSSRVSRLTLDGEMSEVWPGLNGTIGIAFGLDASAYALEFSARGRAPSSGSVLRRWPGGYQETVVTGLNYPTGIAVGPDGDLYVTENGHKSEDGSGRVIRIRSEVP